MTTDETVPDGIDDEVDVETCLAQLREPGILLADALYRIHRADALQNQIDRLVPITDADAYKGEAMIGRQQYLTETSGTLAHIAKIAADMAVQERQAHAQVFTAEQFDRLEAGSGPAYEPQAVNGVRFTADVTCRYMGRVGDALWAYVQGVGFLRVSGAASIDTVTVGMTVGVQFAGRVVSVTPDHALCVTDGGTAVTLPRALVTESPDE